MADVTSLIETMENRWMRAWVRCDIKELKGLTAKDFILLTGTKPPAILDRPSWLDAAGKRYVCSAYRFGRPGLVRPFLGQRHLAQGPRPAWLEARAADRYPR